MPFFFLVTRQSQREQRDHPLHIDKQPAGSAMIQEWGKQDGQTGYGIAEGQDTAVCTDSSRRAGELREAA